jgi:hypothetical protein
VVLPPDSVEERKKGFLSGTGELDADRPDQMPTDNGNDCLRPRWV